MIAIINYPVANIASISNALRMIGHDVVITDSVKVIKDASAIVLPGVGAFAQGMRFLQEKELDGLLTREVVDKGKPFLGICLGMQMLARTSEEFGTHRGLGWLNATVAKINPGSPEFKVPHMGWNDVHVPEGRTTTLFDGASASSTVYYFVHSFHVQVDKAEERCVTGVVHHGIPMVAAYERDNICAVQFHPEKSQQAGLSLLKNFAKLMR